MPNKYQVDIVVGLIDKTLPHLKKIERSVNDWASKQEKALGRHLSINQKIAQSEKSINSSSSASLKLEKERLNVKSLALRNRSLEGRIEKNSLDLQSRRSRLVSNELRDRKTLASISKIESQTNINNARLSSIRDRESRFGTAQRDRAISRAARQQSMANDARQNLYGRTSAIGIGISGIASAFSMKNYMEQEQAAIRMRLQFGNQTGNKLFDELKTFAAQTAFTLKDATQLLEGVKLGAQGLGIFEPEQMMALTKKIAVPILGYVGNREDRNEVTHQLLQIFSKGKANTRQDLMVMQARGLPIFQMLTEFLSKKSGKQVTMKDIQSTYGAETPAKLIAQALEFYAVKPEMFKAMLERSESFTQARDTFSEILSFTSASVGLATDQSFDLGKGLNRFSGLMADFNSMMITKKVGQNGETTQEASTIGKNIIKGFVAGLGLLGLGWALPKIRNMPTKYGWSTPSFGQYYDEAGRPLLKQSGIVGGANKASRGIVGIGKGMLGGMGTPYGALSVATFALTDYKDVFRQIMEDPAKGLANNFMEISAAAIAVTTPLGMLAATLKLLSGGGFLSFQNKPGEYSVKEKLSDKVLNSIYLHRADMLKEKGDIKGASYYENMMVDTNLTSSNINKIKGQYQNPNIVLNVDTNTIVNGETGGTKTKTTIRNPFGNPITKEVWN